MPARTQQYQPSHTCGTPEDEGMRRLVLVAPPWAGLERLKPVARELEERGYPVRIAGEPDCGGEAYNLSWRRLPEGCPGAWVPHLGMIVDVVACLERSGLWGEPERAVAGCLLERLREMRKARAAYKVKGLGVPLRPPPVLVAGELYVRDSVESVCREAERRAGEGADLIVLGLDRWGRGAEERFLEAVSACSRRLPVPVLADPGRLGLLGPSHSAGAGGVMSVRPGEEGRLPEHVRSEAIVVVLADRSPGEAVRAAGRLAMPVLDPVIMPPLLGLHRSLERLSLLAHAWRGPIMAGVNNAYELIDADPTGTIPMLVSLAAEGGASIVLATEESPKTYGATLLARLSADLASLALYYGSPPKDYPIRLLHTKHKNIPMP